MNIGLYSLKNTISLITTQLVGKLNKCQHISPKKLHAPFLENAPCHDRRHCPFWDDNGNKQQRADHSFMYIEMGVNETSLDR